MSPRLRANIWRIQSALNSTQRSRAGCRYSHESVASAPNGAITDPRKARETRYRMAAAGRGGHAKTGTGARGSGGCHAQGAVSSRRCAVGRGSLGHVRPPGKLCRPSGTSGSRGKPASRRFRVTAGPAARDRCVPGNMSVAGRVAKGQSGSAIGPAGISAPYRTDRNHPVQAPASTRPPAIRRAGGAGRSRVGNQGGVPGRIHRDTCGRWSQIHGGHEMKLRFAEGNCTPHAR